jgi:hypothetical protein
VSAQLEWITEADHRIKTPVLQVEDLAISYETRKGDVPAVRDVSFDMRPTVSWASRAAVRAPWRLGL